MVSLRLIANRIPVLLVAVALFLPAIGPLLDHHFAERQPDHLHIGESGFQVHPHDYKQVHYHRSIVTSDYSNKPVALYKNDSNPAAVTVVIAASSDTGSVLQFEPESVFLMPVPTRTQAKHKRRSAGRPESAQTPLPARRAHR